MIYVLTEDSGSGAEMWSSVFQAYSIGCQVNPDALVSGGNSLLRKRLGRWVQGEALNFKGERIVLQGSDIVIIIYDKLGIPDPVTLYKVVSKRFMPKVYFCECSSTEGLLLAFRGLWEWIERDNSSLFSAVMKCARNSWDKYRFWNHHISDCSPEMQPFYKEMARTRIDELRSRESLTSAQRDELATLLSSPDANLYKTPESALAGLLEYITDGTGFWFTKSIMGPCWQVDCCNWESWKGIFRELYDGKCPGIEKHVQQVCGDVIPTEWKLRLRRLAEESHVGKCVVDRDGNHYTLSEFFQLLSKNEDSPPSPQGSERTSCFT